MSRRMHFLVRHCTIASPVGKYFVGYSLTGKVSGEKNRRSIERKIKVHPARRNQPIIIKLDVF